MALPALSNNLVATKRAQPMMVGIQMGAHSFYDEGMEYVLDILKKDAEINTLMFYSHTYYGAESRPLRVMAHDHGVQPRDFENSTLTRVWVKHHDKYFKDTTLRHRVPDSSFEYYDKDIFHEIQKPARDRDMKVYIRLLEASAGHGIKYIENYDKVLTVDIDGNSGSGPCWNNPDYPLFDSISSGRRALFRLQYSSIFSQLEVYRSALFLVQRDRYGCFFPGHVLETFYHPHP